MEANNPFLNSYENNGTLRFTVEIEISEISQSHPLSKEEYLKKIKEGTYTLDLSRNMAGASAPLYLSTNFIIKDPQLLRYRSTKIDLSQMTRLK